MMITNFFQSLSDVKGLFFSFLLAVGLGNISKISRLKKTAPKMFKISVIEPELIGNATLYTVYMTKVDKGKDDQNPQGI